MLVGVPLRKDVPSYQFRTELDSITYTLSIRYNSRMDRWIMDFNTENNSPLVTGIPLLLGTSLLTRFQIQGLPEGDLFLINIENENVEGNRDNFSENVQLFYQEAT